MCKIYGYCRVSTRTQKLDRQIENISKAFPQAQIYKESFTGTTLDRPTWKYLEIRLQEGDTVVFDSVSRMSRNADEGTKLYFELFEKGVNLVFLKEQYINTDIYRESLEKSLPRTNTNVDGILQAIENFLRDLAKEQIRIAFEQAEKEVEDTRQRIKEGLRERKKKGLQVGQVKGKVYKVKKAEESKEKILKLSQDFNGTFTDKEVLDLLKINRNTYYKYKKELREQGE